MLYDNAELRAATEGGGPTTRGVRVKVTTGAATGGGGEWTREFRVTSDVLKRVRMPAGCLAWTRDPVMTPLRRVYVFPAHEGAWMPTVPPPSPVVPLPVAPPVVPPPVVPPPVAPPPVGVGGGINGGGEDGLVVVMLRDANDIHGRGGGDGARGGGDAGGGDV